MLHTALEIVVAYDIQERDVDVLLIGNHGNFDSICNRVLEKRMPCTHITYHVLLAYMPKESA